MRLAVLSAVAKLLGIRFKVDGLAYGSTVVPPRLRQTVVVD
jgi:hypothetical protein